MNKIPASSRTGIEEIPGYDGCRCPALERERNASALLGGHYELELCKIYLSSIRLVTPALSSFSAQEDAVRTRKSMRLKFMRKRDAALV